MTKRSTRALLLLLTLVVIFLSASAGDRKVYPYRWVFVSTKLHSDDGSVEKVEGIIKTASEHGLNGMVLSASFGWIDRVSPDYFKRLEKVKQIAAEHNIEIIPQIFSAGYGGGVLAVDRNLAAGFPVKDALFVAKDGEARLVPDPAVEIANGGFEEYEGNRFKEYWFHDRPGEVSFVDTEVFKSGKASIRFEGFGEYEHGHARVMQEVKVNPRRCYRVSYWARAEALEPEASFKMTVLSPDKRTLAAPEVRIKSTSGWRKMTVCFNSLEYDTVRIYVGVWGGKSGKFWIDDLEVEEAGLLNVLRRPGTPVTVKGEESGTVYEEGRDFARIEDPKLSFWSVDRDPPVIKILPDGRVKDGERLRVSYYHGLVVSKGQVAVCMSEPKLYDVWRKKAELVHEHLSPKRYLLSMDEIRQGGSCEACKKRKTTMGRILGDCITKQAGIIRKINPDAEIFIWSDMLDPNHNAHDKYYMVDGDYTGSWKHIPKDLVIVCWHYRIREKSLKFFSSLGFRTMAGAYYDGDTLENPKGWLESLKSTPRACGIMYTTWRNKYELLAPFGDLVSGKK